MHRLSGSRSHRQQWRSLALATLIEAKQNDNPPTRMPGGGLSFVTKHSFARMWERIL